jgi:hypothetical protein
MPVVTGSDRPTNTMGIVRVKSRNTRAVGVLVATSTSGAIAISSRAHAAGARDPVRDSARPG